MHFRGSGYQITEELSETLFGLGETSAGPGTLGDTSAGAAELGQ